MAWNCSKPLSTAACRSSGSSGAGGAPLAAVRLVLVIALDMALPPLSGLWVINRRRIIVAFKVPAGRGVVRNAATSAAVHQRGELGAHCCFQQRAGAQVTVKF